jgi:hypothetical protein
MQSTYTHKSLDCAAAEYPKAVPFQTSFAGYMEMYSDAQTVAAYLQAHEGWFCRCAEPMKTSPFGENGYILTVGKYGAFGYEVEPKMGIVLDPPSSEGVYRMQSVPIPDDSLAGYQVDYQATMSLVEVPYSSKSLTITRVSWELHMTVIVSFPKFVYKLPMSLIQQTGDRLLCQIVRQISPRLTYKVQQDFHKKANLPIPPKSSRQLLPI